MATVNPVAAITDAMTEVLRNKKTLTKDKIAAARIILQAQGITGSGGEDTGEAVQQIVEAIRSS